MQKDLKFNIITEGQKNGISSTCRKYNISRTIYYKWLKRYQSLGMEGLEDIKKDFVPINKTNQQIEKAILNLIRTYPNYGPRAIKYLLEEINYHVSESAVFNVMKRNNLTNKENRLRFARKRRQKQTQTIPPISELNSGECWLFWITDYGNFDNIGNLYEYTIFDLKSRIACSRLYTDICYEHFEDLLTGVALPIELTLNLNARYLCFFSDSKLLKHSSKDFVSKLNDILIDSGFDIDIHIIKTNDNNGKLLDFRSQYTKGSMTSLLPLINSGMSFVDLKAQLQQHVRNYNINNKHLYDTVLYSPIEYHNHLTNSKLILPIWAYINRQY
ncbi:MAG: helix-turn-helix domain-containing protein [Vallitalea sp.]|jgi:transposase-like protein|nr:helix-turn-helix domain-containing protein [Vallitalea sp.]